MLLRKRFGQEICLLTLCAPAGDQCPVDLVHWVEPENEVNIQPDRGTGRPWTHRMKKR